MKPIKNIDDPRYVKAMSHPLRVRILAMLDQEPKRWGLCPAVFFS